MFKLNQKGVVHVLVPILLLAGIMAGVYLVLEGPKIFKPRATGEVNILFVDDKGNTITQTSSAKVMVKLTAPQWLAPPPTIISSNVGPNNPNVATTDQKAKDVNPWKSPTNVLVSDDKYAFVEVNKNKTSAALKATGFNLKVPDNANIAGIEVQIERKSRFGRGVVDKDVKLIKASVVADNNKAQPSVWSNKDQVVTYGGAKDLWNQTWTPADINNTNFGVSLTTSYSQTAKGGNDTAYVDNINIKVYYTTTTNPPALTTTSVNLSEDPNFLINKQTINFTTEPISYTFSDAKAGTKTLYAKFIASDGQEQNANPFPATIELVGQPVSQPIYPTPITYQTPSYGTPSYSYPSPPSYTTPVPIPTTSPTSKRVFVSSTFYKGNLGGLAGADTKCQDRANAANLGGTWKAWLSDDVTSASSRLQHSTVPYKRVDGVTIANNWTDLTDGTLVAPISITESGGYTGGFIPWTNTGTDGLISVPSKSCNNWTTSAANVYGERGNAGGTNFFWTSGYAIICETNAPLYCFEQ